MTMLSRTTLIDRVDRAFREAFGSVPQLWAQAPARVNLIGEHTDYNGGFVLPCAIDFQTVVAAKPRSDMLVRVLALDEGAETDTFAADKPIAPEHGASWTHYVRGMAHAMQRRGRVQCGVDLVVSGNVPQGAGLSSSASLAVAVGMAFKTLWHMDGVEKNDLAMAAQEAEHQFAGCQCGLMDPLSCLHGQQGHALLIDCQNLQVSPVPLPEGAVTLVVHSGIRRGLVQGEYNLRRAQCEQAAKHWGASNLRGVDHSVLAHSLGGLDPVVFKRARHVLTENQRTLAATQALARGDLTDMGSLMALSHASMRDDFEITLPPIDKLVSLIQDVLGSAGGARMTGGGFGGCVVALLPETLVEPVCDALSRHYRCPDGQVAQAYVCRASAGAGLFVADALDSVTPHAQ